MRFWQAALAALSGVVVSASAAEAGSSFVYIAPPKASVSSSFTVVGEPPGGSVREAAGNSASKTGREDPAAKTAVAASATPSPPRPGVKRSPLDAPPNYRWNTAPVVISASVIALGEPAVETPRTAPIPQHASRPIAVARAAPVTVIRDGVIGGAFPGGVTVIASSAPAAAAGKAPSRIPKPRPLPPARQPVAPPPPRPAALPPPGPPQLLDPGGGGALKRIM